MDPLPNINYIHVQAKTSAIHIKTILGKMSNGTIVMQQLLLQLACSLAEVLPVNTADEYH